MFITFYLFSSFLLFSFYHIFFNWRGNRPELRPQSLELMPVVKAVQFLN